MLRSTAKLAFAMSRTPLSSPPILTRVPRLTPPIIRSLSQSIRPIGKTPLSTTPSIQLWKNATSVRPVRHYFFNSNDDNFANDWLLFQMVTNPDNHPSGGAGLALLLAMGTLYYTLDKKDSRYNKKKESTPASADAATSESNTPSASRPK